MAGQVHRASAELRHSFRASVGRDRHRRHWNQLPLPAARRRQCSDRSYAAADSGSSHWRLEEITGRRRFRRRGSGCRELRSFPLDYGPHERRTAVHTIGKEPRGRQGEHLQLERRPERDSDIQLRPAANARGCLRARHRSHGQ